MRLAPNRKFLYISRPSQARSPARHFVCWEQKVKTRLSGRESEQANKKGTIHCSSGGKKANTPPPHLATNRELSPGFPLIFAQARLSSALPRARKSRSRLAIPFTPGSIARARRNGKDKKDGNFGSALLLRKDLCGKPPPSNWRARLKEGQEGAGSRRLEML